MGLDAKVFEIRSKCRNYERPLSTQSPDSTLTSTGKLRGCDVVKVGIGDLVNGGRIRMCATVVQHKTGRPVQSGWL